MAAHAFVVREKDVSGHLTALYTATDKAVSQVGMLRDADRGSLS